MRYCTVPIAEVTDLPLYLSTLATPWHACPEATGTGRKKNKRDKLWIAATTATRLKDRRRGPWAGKTGSDSNKTLGSGYAIDGQGLLKHLPGPDGSLLAPL